MSKGGVTLRRGLTWATLVAGCWCVLAVAAAGKPLVLGVFPYVSVGKLITHQKAFKDYLETAMGRPISMVTAPDFKTYVARVRAGEYDLILAAPHIGRYGEVQAGYQRIAMTRHHVQGCFLVRKDSPFKGVGDLRGKVIAIAAPVSIVYQLSVNQLHSLGLVNGETITILGTTSHNNAIFSLLKGESDAAVTGIKLWDSLPADHKRRLRLLAKTREVPGFMLMARGDVPPETVRHLHDLALAFGNTPAGQRYLFGGFQPIDSETMDSMDPYIEILR